MKTKQQRVRQIVLEATLVAGIGLVCCALGGIDWRLGLGFLGVVFSGAALWGLFRGKDAR